MIGVLVYCFGVALLVMISTSTAVVVGRDYFFIMYSIWFVWTLIFLLAHTKKVLGLFTPSFMAVVFLGLNFTAGAYYGGKGFMSPAYRKVYYDLSDENFIFANIFLILSLTIITIVAIQSNKVLARSRPPLHYATPASTAQINIFIATLLLLASIPIEINQMFGIRFGLLIIVFYYATFVPRMRSILFAMTGMLVVIVTSFQNKREIIICFLLLLIILQWKRHSALKISIVQITLALLSVTMGVFLILWMSLLRGYGGFQFSNPFEAILFLSQYIDSDYFLYNFLENFEVTHTYPAAIVGVSLVLEGTLQLELGRTLIKPLFLPLPRDIFPFKPDSILKIYTDAVDPGYWNKGGSLPTSLPTEIFINFHIFGIFFIWMFLKVADWIFLHAVQATSLTLKSFTNLTIGALMFFFTRGSGFDLFTLTCLMSVFSYIGFLIIKLPLSQRKVSL